MTGLKCGGDVQCFAEFVDVKLHGITISGAFLFDDWLKIIRQIGIVQDGFGRL